METITRINGNGNPYTVDLPRIIIQAPHLNDVGLKRLSDNTALAFQKTGLGYEAQPTQHWQLSTLLLTYNFKTKYYNNGSFQNTLFLRFDHHVGFKVTSICRDCAEHNGVGTQGLTATDRLAC